MDSFLSSNSSKGQGSESTSADKKQEDSTTYQVGPDGQDNLPHLFANHGLAKYTDLFLQQEIDIPMFASMTEDDLKEIGIQTFGARKKLLLLASRICQVWTQLQFFQGVFHLVILDSTLIQLK